MADQPNTRGDEVQPEDPPGGGSGGPIGGGDGAGDGDGGNGGGNGGDGGNGGGGGNPPGGQGGGHGGGHKDPKPPKSKDPSPTAQITIHERHRSTDPDDREAMKVSEDPGTLRCISSYETLVAQLGSFPTAVQTRFGRVEFESIEVHTDDDGGFWLDIRLGSAAGGDCHFRIFNPPLLVQASDGDIKLGGDRYRMDPVQAVAEVVANHGGLSTRRKR
jgi:hypothetical protein